LSLITGLFAGEGRKGVPVSFAEVIALNRLKMHCGEVDLPDPVQPEHEDCVFPRGIAFHIQSAAFKKEMIWVYLMM